MAFDPDFPQDGAPLDPAAMRDQLSELKALIDAQAALIVTLQAQVAALEAGLAGTALNPTVGTFSTSFSEPPLASQVQAVLDFTNSLSTSLTRV